MQLGLPEVLKKVSMASRGLVLFIGGTGMGKSTSLACMIGYRNANAEGHIITIEDPIEFIHQHKRCIVNQREIGMDTDSWEDAMSNAMRQAPDVILIGEIRDRETMEHALAFAESGHLTLATLHANNANQALDRIERAYLERALECSQGNKSRAAELLDITFRSLRYRLDKLGIETVLEQIRERGERV